MLLSISEILTQIGDWIVVHCAELGITISIPILVGFVLKVLFNIIKNKQTIKNAVLSATNTLITGTDSINLNIDLFKKDITNMLTEFENKIDKKIDDKFTDLHKKRRKAYNNIVNGITEEEQEEIKTEVIAPVLETLKTNSEEIKNTIEEVVEPVVTNTKKVIKKVRKHE